MSLSNLAPDVRATVQQDARWILVERIVESSTFRASARLREFLFYIADCAIRNAPEEATEQQIGLRVFHRTPGYNSSEDSIVRTHARLLRQKLAIYFAEEGIHEPILVEVPKGHYLPVFLPRGKDPVVPVPEVPLADAPLATAVEATPGSQRRWWLAALLVAASFACGIFVTNHWARRSSTDAAVEKLWKPFLAGDPPLVVFSNALFSGDSKRGLSYASPVADINRQGDGNLVDTYTGIGELAAVYTITRLFDAHQAHFILKRSRLMTWDEAKVRNLIFIGSTAENSSLSALQATQDFTIVSTPDDAGIVNHHPRPGEPSIYSRPEHPLNRDYAILALLPGMQAGEHILIFSGLTTFGTQAAVDFVCRPETVASLIPQISGPKGEIHPFEAIIETTVTGGVPVEAHLVTVHVH